MCTPGAAHATKNLMMSSNVMGSDFDIFFAD